jgi:predicted nucleic-acid-binding protein
VLVRYLARDDKPLHAVNRDLFDTGSEGSAGAVILQSVIAESIYVLTKIYKVPRSEAAECLIDILRFKGMQTLIKKSSSGHWLFTPKGTSMLQTAFCA